VDYQPRSGVRPKKSARDRLIRLAQAHPSWVLGFGDETWWSRLAQPAMHTWTELDQPLRLVEQTVAKTDPDPKALACYGLLRTDVDQVWLRFVDGRPISALTTQFLDWCLARLATEGKTALLLVWDNATWHRSAEVRAWVRQHNRQVKQTRQGARLLTCRLPVKSPWLNNIEPHWVHGKRNVAEADRLLTGQELADRVCAYFHCTHDDHLAIPEKAA
jgi:transposase